LKLGCEGEQRSREINRERCREKEVISKIDGLSSFLNFDRNDVLIVMCS
jgi:hypothetical protein